MKADHQSPALAKPQSILPIAAVGLVILWSFAVPGCSQPEQPVTIDQDRDRAEKMLGLAAPGETRPIGSSKATPAPLPKSNVDLIPTTTDRLKDRLAALAERAELRAYWGAPPVVPHEIGQFESAADCRTCHDQDSDEAAPRTPHVHLAGCTQCHVEQERELFFELELADNSFRGLPEPIGGQRAWPGAPPTIPHPTFMRNRCLSCHGPDSRVGIRTDHPERQSCQQCHAPSAKINQRLVGDTVLLPLLSIETP